MLFIEVLSNDEGSVIEDAKYSAGSDAADAAAVLSRPAGSRGKTVPRPYTPPDGHKPDLDPTGEDSTAITGSKLLSAHGKHSVGCL